MNFDPAEHGDSFGASFLEQLSRPGDSGESILGQTVWGEGRGKDRSPSLALKSRCGFGCQIVVAKTKINEALHKSVTLEQADWSVFPS